MTRTCATATVGHRRPHAGCSMTIRSRRRPACGCARDATGPPVQFQQRCCDGEPTGLGFVPCLISAAAVLAALPCLFFSHRAPLVTNVSLSAGSATRAPLPPPSVARRMANDAPTRVSSEWARPPQAARGEPELAWIERNITRSVSNKNSLYRLTPTCVLHYPPHRCCTLAPRYSSLITMSWSPAPHSRSSSKSAPAGLSTASSMPAAPAGT